MPMLNQATGTRTWIYGGRWFADTKIVTDRSNGYGVGCASELEALENLEGQLRMSLAAVEARAAKLRSER